MLLSTSHTAIFLAILPFTIAATCDSSSATLYASTPGGTSQSVIDASYTKCVTGCGTSASCLVGCLNTACSTYCGSSTSSCYPKCQSDVCSAFYGSGSSTPDKDKLNACYKSKGLKRSVLETRATLDCTSSEVCYKESNGNLFCLNISTGNYHDAEGGTGNVKTGAYTSGVSAGVSSTRASSSSTRSASSGSASSGSSAASVTSTRAAGTTSVAPVTALSSVTTTPTTATASSGASSGSVAAAAAATTTRSAGQQKFAVDGLVGVVGLAVGFGLF